MESFDKRFKFTLEPQKEKELKEYLGNISDFTEEKLFKMMRKIKEMERRIKQLEDENKYSR